MAPYHPQGESPAVTGVRSVCVLRLLRSAIAVKVELEETLFVRVYPVQKLLTFMRSVRNTERYLPFILVLQTRDKNPRKKIFWRKPLEFIWNSGKVPLFLKIIKKMGFHNHPIAKLYGISESFLKI